MIVFSSKVKEELCNIKLSKFCCTKSMLLALLVFGNTKISDNHIYFKTKNKNIFDLVFKLATTVYPSKITVKYKGNSYDNLVIKTKNTDLNINPHKDCCQIATMRGIFLQSATITNPTKSYRLEFNILKKENADILCNIIKQTKSLNVTPHISLRGKYHCVYFNGYDDVEQLLTFIGAFQAVMELVQVKMVREERNRINRTVNFETANMSRGATACAKQLKAIKTIEKKIGLDNLEPKLKEIAILRIENPNMTLVELSKITGLSKTTISYRFKKIIEKSENHELL